MIKKFFLFLLVMFIGVVVYYFFPESGLPAGKTIDKLEVFKEKKELIAYSGQEVLKSYSIALGRKPSDKSEFGDEEDLRLPPGEYVVIDKDSRSRFRKNISFADVKTVVVEDGKYKKQKKVGSYMIHGMRRGYGFIGKFHRWYNWTKGGVAVTDEEIDDLFKNVEPGVKVVINP